MGTIPTPVRVPRGKREASIERLPLIQIAPHGNRRDTAPAQTAGERGPLAEGLSRQEVQHREPTAVRAEG